MRPNELPDPGAGAVHAVSGGASVGWVAVPSALEASTYWGSVALVSWSSTHGRATRLNIFNEKIGYTLAGIIPRYARGTTGTLEPTSIMYKELKEVAQDTT